MRGTLLLIGMLAGVIGAGRVRAEARERPGAVRPAATAPAEANTPQGVEGEAPPPPPKDPKEMAEFIRGANLETDAESQALLRRAREHMAEKRWREAVTVLQRVIDRPGGTLSTVDGRVYRPTRAVATEMLAAMPREGLEGYRLWADGEAKGIAGDVNICVEAEALDPVVRRFFLSSLGDDAALRLASLAIDRHDHRTARRLLTAILTTYPDPSVDRGAVLARLALACARLGDRAGAAAAWAKLSALPNKTLSPAALAAIEEQVMSGGVPKEPPGADWAMAFGSALRRGWTADLPPGQISLTDTLWTIHWESTFALEVATGRRVMPRGAGQRNMLVGWWDQSKAVPACQPVIAADRVFFKTVDSLVCCSLATGRRLWEIKEHVAAEKNPNAPSYAYYGPWDPAPPALFIDQLGRSLSVIDNRVYHIEENSRSTSHDRGVVVVPGRPQPAEPLDGNSLSAHEASTGKRLWRLGRESDEKKPFAAVRFLAVPAPCMDRLLVPVEDNGEMMLVALNPADGSPVWKTFLCTDTTAKRFVSRSVGLWVDGTEVLVASGKGVVFALDGADGSLAWASRYEPATPKESGNMKPSTRSRRDMSPDGFQENYIGVDGNTVVVGPTDRDSILALDRRSGTFLYAQDVKDPRCCVGTADGGLFVAGGEGVARLDIARGDWTWRHATRDIRGRGVLAGDALYIPAGKRVLRLDHRTGKLLVDLLAKLPADDPVGNVLIAGPHILVGGMDRLASLANARR
jgi:outer membrane protein assembly factor BamB